MKAGGDQDLNRGPGNADRLQFFQEDRKNERMGTGPRLIAYGDGGAFHAPEPVKVYSANRIFQTAGDFSNRIGRRRHGMRSEHLGASSLQRRAAGQPFRGQKAFP